MTLRFTYDVVCPYAYLASTVVEGLAASAGLEVDYQPILLGGVFRALQGPDSPMAKMSVPRARLNLADISRQAEMLGVPLTFPAEHPRRTVNAMRLILGTDRAHQRLMMARLFQAYWQEGLDVSDRTVLDQIAREMGTDPAVIDNPSVKEALFARTAEAVEAGVFGVPALGFGDRFWWGADRMHLAARAMGVEHSAFPSAPGLLQPNGSIAFFYDFSSPYSYLAATQVAAFAKKWGAKVEWVPILLGALFREIGADNAPLLSMGPAKARYMGRDLHDWAGWWGVPFQMSPHFPLRTVLPLRVALIEPAVIPVVYQAAWGDGKDIGKAEVLRVILDEAGFNGAALIEGTQQDPIKLKLRENTARARDLGCCGVPSFWVNDAVLVWGQDRFSQVEWALHGWRPEGG